MTKIKIDPMDSWAMVELYRWQYNELPNENYKPLDISKALLNMAKKLKSGKQEDIPSIFNVMTVLQYLGRTYDFS